MDLSKTPEVVKAREELWRGAVVGQITELENTGGQRVRAITLKPDFCVAYIHSAVSLHHWGYILTTRCARWMQQGHLLCVIVSVSRYKSLLRHLSAPTTVFVMSEGT
jgi:hypothetical protein